ncbi:MAG: hypothetical protein KJ799_10295 [Bacteroidetes bacterium]|nr:hypothetical protein [Bacteroidota bacterium]MBU1678100.1 hypothetical protein [Bacteroidota bacterium]MBU2507097.1 hypothetical protein [Bacteroidota bacterium]
MNPKDLNLLKIGFNLGKIFTSKDKIKYLVNACGEITKLINYIEQPREFPLKFLANETVLKLDANPYAFLVKEIIVELEKRAEEDEHITEEMIHAELEKKSTEYNILLKQLAAEILKLKNLGLSVTKA